MLCRLSNTCPQEFNSSQRAAFCVYSGPGVSQLRDYLSELFNAITDEIAGQSGTEYDDETEAYVNHMDIDEDDEDGDDEAAEEDTPVNDHALILVESREATPAVITHSAPDDTPVAFMSREMQMSRERAQLPIPRNGSNVSSNGPSSSSSSAAIVPPRRPRGFGHQPIIEASTSPTPSDNASNRSGGTNHSTGTGFFRHYTEISAAPRAGVITPDLVFAEIGHGRGAGAAAGPSHHGTIRRGTDPIVVVPPAHASTFGSLQVDPPSFASSPSSHTVHVEDPGSEQLDDFGAVLVDTSNSYLQHSPRSEAAWTHVAHESLSRSLSASPTTRELQQSVQSVLGHRQFVEGREVDGRGRSVKRSLRNTITAAEQYASSFFFGRGNGGAAHDGGGGPSNYRDGR